MAKRRKLNNTHRVKIINFAATRLKMLPEREDYKLKVKAFQDSLVADLKTITPDELAVLARYTNTREVKNVFLPSVFSVIGPDREFTHENGDVVKRLGERRNIEMADLDYTFSAEDWNSVSHRFRNTNSIRACCRTERLFPLGATVVLPEFMTWRGDYLALDWSMETGLRMYSGHGSLKGVTISSATNAAYAEMMLANEVIALGETGLLASIYKLVKGAEFFEQVVAMFGEAEEIETELYGIPKIVGTALMTLNDDERKALCSNMAARGKGSEICTIASAA